MFRMIGLLIVFLAAATAQAQTTLAIKPHRPFLNFDENSKICQPYLNSWLAVFDGDGDLIHKTGLNLSNLSPRARVSVFPKEGERGLYNDSYAHFVDMDDDGDLEVLHIDSYDVGWRYLGVWIYQFNSEEDYQAARDKKDNHRSWGLSLDNINSPNDVKYRKIFSYPPVSSVQIVELDGGIYTTITDKVQFSSNPTVARLVQLNAPVKPKTICAVTLLPPMATFKSFTQTSKAYENLLDFYGGSVPNRSMCGGSMGWTAPPPDSLLPTLFYRPQVLNSTLMKENSRLASSAKKDSDGLKQAAIRTDTARELRFIMWGLGDSQSWQDYMDLKLAYPDFIEDMKIYYRVNFTDTFEEAEILAKDAWKDLLDGIFYGRSGDPGRLIEAALEAEKNLTPETHPHDVARVVADSRLEDNANNRSALLAATYTHQPIDKIDLIWQKMVYSFDERLASEKREKRRSYLINVHKNALSTALIASLGNDELTKYFLKQGADANAPTNGFKKTPLMYAAQHNQLSAVKLLLDSGVNVNLQTNVLKNSCLHLDRDNRTTLMYAAENASFELLEQLLLEGADVALRDTKGNAANWYFEKNAIIVDKEKRQSITDKLTTK